MRSMLVATLLLLTTCASGVPEPEPRVPIFNIVYHCGEADACRAKEYGSTSDTERLLCLDGMLRRVTHSKARDSRILVVQQLECSLQDDGCGYLECMSLHQDHFRRFND